MPSAALQALRESSRRGGAKPVLNHMGPVRVGPSISPFVIKMATYFRMAEIPYNVCHTNKVSSKGKTPYILHDAEDIEDTSFIISYLNETFGKDLNSTLSDADKAISRAFLKMAEENTYWTLIHYRYIESNILMKQTPLTGLKKNLWNFYYKTKLKPTQKANLHGHGIGRHTKDEVHEILKKDLRAFSVFLGEKQFFMGDVPTEIDAFLFGLFACFCYMLPDSPHEKLCKETYSNLFAYTERMRRKYWSDWEESCVPDKTKEEEQPKPPTINIVPPTVTEDESVEDNESIGGEGTSKRDLKAALQAMLDDEYEEDTDDKNTKKDGEEEQKGDMREEQDDPTHASGDGA